MLVDPILEEIGDEKAIIYIECRDAVATVGAGFRSRGVSVGEVIGGADDIHIPGAAREKTILDWLKGDIQVEVYCGCSALITINR